VLKRSVDAPSRSGKDPEAALLDDLVLSTRWIGSRQSQGSYTPRKPEAGSRPRWGSPSAGAQQPDMALASGWKARPTWLPESW